MTCNLITSHTVSERNTQLKEIVFKFDIIFIIQQKVYPFAIPNYLVFLLQTIVTTIIDTITNIALNIGCAEFHQTPP